LELGASGFVGRSDDCSKQKAENRAARFEAAPTLEELAGHAAFAMDVSCYPAIISMRW
jgi:hypothetical protein